jgi:hypothetical protein
VSELFSRSKLMPIQESCSPVNKLVTRKPLPNPGKPISPGDASVPKGCVVELEVQ